MNRMIIVLAGIFFIMWAPSAFARNDYYYTGESQNGGSFNFFIGSKSLDDIWDPVENQMDIGLKFDFKKKDWPVSVAFDILSSYDTKLDTSYSPAVEFTGNTLEKNFGLRFGSQVSPSLNVFTGGGVSFINATFKGTESGVTISDSGSAVGNWFEVGLCLTADNLNVGIDVIKSSGDVSMYGISGDAGGLHFGLLFGFRW